MILTDIRLARPADLIDLSDLTASKRTGPAYFLPYPAVDTLVMPLHPEPTATEAEAIRRRLVTEDAAGEQRIEDIAKALADPITPEWARLTLESELARQGIRPAPRTPTAPTPRKV